MCIIVKEKPRKDANTNELYLLKVLQRYESDMLPLLLSDNERIRYIAKKLLKRFKCDSCKEYIIGSNDEWTMSNQVLIMQIADFVSCCDAILDFANNVLRGTWI